MSIIIKGKTLDEYIKEQSEHGEVLENVCGTMHGCRTTMSQVYGDHDNFLITNNATVTIRRGEERHTLRGNRIEKKGGKWYVDGKVVDWDTIGGEYKPENVVSIEIHGNVNSLRTQMGDIKVVGDVQNINTTSGDVECQSAYNINTTSGDVTCGNVGGDVHTISGDINCKHD